ncbi:hypothetical protein JZO73_15290 [Enterococcus plantarum]|uniref:hypothetical protein n=1 Tax=Enterococcus plantarum TaxID=1077675 RepID=UPI001A8DA249|nr:hypothetical protein [Enterococcus plantarum]MBO0468865.1 hypothetical protein [Enterococcus plantarum]
MYQKLQTFLKENKANFTIKYDSEREDNNYTVVLFDTKEGVSICSGDANSIDILEKKITETLSINIEFNEINRLFYLVEDGLSHTKVNYFIIGIYQVKDSLEYRISIFGESIDTRESFCSFEELERFIKKNYE